MNWGELWKLSGIVIVVVGLGDKAVAREIMRGPWEVGRVIARPFEGEPGNFRRTPNRHDYAVPPPRGMLLDRLEENHIEIRSVGKIFTRGRS